MSAVQQSVSTADPLPRALRACVQSARDLPLPVYALRAPFQSQAAGRAVRQKALLTAPCEALGDLSLRTLVRREGAAWEPQGVCSRLSHLLSSDCALRLTAVLK